MIEYPSIINSSKAPRKHCVAFDKLDGSNIRAKYTHKNGFELFGTRTQLINETTPFWNIIIEKFQPYKETLEAKFKKDKDYRDFREIIVYGELVGPNSFAGRHPDDSSLLDIVFFDVLTGHKQRKFVGPKQFIKDFAFLPQPEVVYEGNLNEEFIKQIRENTTLKEGVICKGTETSGAFAGGVWMCKIKTQAYIDKLKDQFKEDWQKYGE